MSRIKSKNTKPELLVKNIYMQKGLDINLQKKINRKPRLGY